MAESNEQEEEQEPFAKIQTLQQELANVKNARKEVERQVEELKHGDAEVKKHNKEIEDLKTDVELEKKLTKLLEAEKEFRQELSSSEVGDRERERLTKLVEEKERLIELTRGERLAVNLGRLQEQIEKRPEESEESDPDELAQKLKKVEEGEIEEIKRALEKEFKNRKKKALAEKSTRRRRFWQFRRNSKSEVTDKDIESCIEDELGNPKLPDCYEEIRTLLYVEKDDVRKKALGTWEDRVTLFTKRVERKKNKVGDLKNEVYQLIGFFSVFQGVLLTAVSQSNLLHCNNLWSPILLSVVASIVTVAGVIQKLNQISDYQKTVHSEERSLKVW